MMELLGLRPATQNFPKRPEQNMLPNPRTRRGTTRACLVKGTGSLSCGPTERAYPLHALLLALALASCKHVSELQVASNASAATAAQTETHEVKSEGPEHIVMTVEEYEQLCPGQEARAGGRGAPETAYPPSAAVRPQDLPDSNRASGSLGILTRRTVTVTDRGPSLDDLRSLSSLQSKVNTALAVHELKKDGPAGLLGLLGGLWPVVLIGGAVLAGLVVWKLRPPWLSFLFKLLGRST